MKDSGSFPESRCTRPTKSTHSEVLTCSNESNSLKVCVQVCQRPWTEYRKSRNSNQYHGIASVASRSSPTTRATHILAAWDNACAARACQLEDSSARLAYRNAQHGLLPFPQHTPYPRKQPRRGSPSGKYMSTASGRTLDHVPRRLGVTGGRALPHCCASHEPLHRNGHEMLRR